MPEFVKRERSFYVIVSNPEETQWWIEDSGSVVVEVFATSLEAQNYARALVRSGYEIDSEVYRHANDRDAREGRRPRSL